MHTNYSMQEAQAGAEAAFLRNGWDAEVTAIKLDAIAGEGVYQTWHVVLKRHDRREPHNYSNHILVMKDEDPKEPFFIRGSYDLTEEEALAA